MHLYLFLVISTYLFVAICRNGIYGKPKFLDSGGSMVAKLLFYIIFYYFILYFIEYCRKRITWEECKEQLFIDRGTEKKKKHQRVPKGPLDMNRKENRNTRKYRKFNFLQQHYGRDRSGTIRDVIDGKLQYDRKEEVLYEGARCFFLIT